MGTERRGRVPFGRTFTTLQNGSYLVPFLPFLAFDALLVFALLAFLTFLALFAFASHISVGEAFALAFPCIRTFAFTSSFFVFFLHCRIAHDSCGQVIARKSKRDQKLLTYNKKATNDHTQTNKPTTKVSSSDRRDAQW